MTNHTDAWPPAAGAIAAHALLARLGIRADEPSAALAARVIDALTQIPPEEVPTLRHEEAAVVGQRLASQWQFLVGTPAPASDDLVWADLVQGILRHARELAAEGDLKIRRTP